jgi:ubiquitin-protein ligase
MNIWFLSDPIRAEYERQRIADLKDQSWLQGGIWLLRGGHLCYDSEIVIAETIYAVTLRYPVTFPTTPPYVLPRGEATRWSEHQYGAGGELCLEYGADNWHSDLTGADLLLSAYRLLLAEGGIDDRVRQEVQSRHKATEGQRLRSRWLRWVQTGPLMEIVTSVVGPCDLTVRLTLTENTMTAVVSKVVALQGTEWLDPTLPIEHMPSQWRLVKGFLLPAAAPNQPVTDWNSLLEAALACGANVEKLKTGEVEVVLVIGEEGPKLLWVWRDDGRVLPFEPLPPQVENSKRLQPEYERLARYRVAVVGNGSMGSKIAASLARAGVLDFLLIDDDVFRPENIIRNDLDWRQVGEHKVEGVTHRILNIAPGATCDLRRARLSGQESSGHTADVVHALSEADVIVDASADPEVFNLLSMIIKASGKKLVWGEVFAGGIGGLIARHRPGVDPHPQAMRLAMLRWCEEQQTPPPPVPTAPYETNGEAFPLVADDADVSVIAGYLTQLVTDLLVKEESNYPCSMYLIGMKPGWIFRQPFETFPLDIGKADEDAYEPADPIALERGCQFVLELISKSIDAIDHPD